MNANAKGKTAMQIRKLKNRMVMVDINFNGLVFNLHKTFKSESIIFVFNAMRFEQI